MTYLQRVSDVKAEDVGGRKPPKRHPVILVVEDGNEIAAMFQPICDFLEVGVEHLSSESDLIRALSAHQPMGLVTCMDGVGQDGCHVMMTVAQYDSFLPILLLTGDDAALAGAADAVAELWHLDSVTQYSSLPSVGNIVDFLFRAGRKGQCMRLVTSR